MTLRVAKNVARLQDSIFGQMSIKARELRAVNLAQGFPDFPGPDFLTKYASEFTLNGPNQYAPPQGLPELRNSVRGYYKNCYNADIDHENEITITAGATEAIYLAISSLVESGDEVIVIDPFYESYVNSIQLAGGKAVSVSLEGSSFEINFETLEARINSNTKMLIINNPHNPTGKVWMREELEKIVKLAIENDIYLLSDEVYEFLTFDGATHIPIRTLSNEENIIMISSAGKTFGLTGWKIGWVIAHSNVTTAMRRLHQNVMFCVSTPLQMAVAKGLEHLDTYIDEFRSTYKAKRDYFYHGLKKLGFEFPIPKGTYFMMVPIDKLTNKSDIDFCWELMQRVGVAAIPPSLFYLEPCKEKYIRLCFAKSESTLDMALERLKNI